MQIRLNPSFCLFWSLVLIVTTPASAASDLTTVVLTGNQAPGLDAAFTQLFDADFNDLGQVVIENRIAGTGVGSANDVGVWLFDPSMGLKQIAREGDSLPSGETYRGFTNSVLDNLGNLAIVALTNGPNGESAGIWHTATPGDSLMPIVRASEIAPGANLPFGNFSYLAISDNGQLAFRSGFGRSNPEGFWRSDANGNISLIALEYGGGSFDTVFSTFGGFSMNSAGRFALASGLINLPPSSGQSGSLWRDTPSGFQMLAQHGDPAPGTSAHFDGFGSGPQPMIDANGQLTFVARLVGAGVTGLNDSSIWRQREEGAPELYLRSGVDGPEGSAAKFANFMILRQNSLGQVAFSATLQDGSSFPHGIWKENGLGQIQQVALQGETAPGSTYLFSSIDSLSHSYNDLGQVAFRADIVEPSTDPRPSRLTGIWAQNIHGVLQKIALEGETINVSDDPSQPDLRTIRYLNFGLGDNLNNRGQLLFNATFTDGSSGAFISNLVAVPEPNTMVLLLCACATLTLSRKA